MKNKIAFALSLLLMFGTFSCTLNEDLSQDLTGKQGTDFLTGSADISALLESAYQQLRLPYQDQSRFWAAQEHTSDEVMGPTRGGDWDDNGVWRVLHNHTWSADHAFLGDTFNELLQVVFSTTNILSFDPPAEQAAEARFLRAFVMFSIVDGWGQVPFRDPGENLLNPPKVLSGADAVDLIISELNEIMPDLPDGPTYRANKDAARVLLMKAYLNKGAFANKQSPTFDNADMAQVVTLADQLINSGKYEVMEDVFDNFAPNNDVISTENIFTNQNQGGTSSGNVRSRWFCTLHYNQNPSGWNGFTTIADFYDKFDPNDKRLGEAYPGITDVGGVRAGFLIGQQYDQDGNALQDRKGNPLVFTKEVKLIESGNTLELPGIRVIKYPIDYNSGDNADNDYVFFRYADVLLMKSEALLREGGSMSEALDAINEIRGKRNVPDYTTLTLEDVYNERGFELYWEGWRRQDMIRFGHFLDAYNEKPASGPERLLFPIPAQALAVNPNLVQNPGY